MQELTLSYKNKKIVVKCENTLLENISFDECFEISASFTQIKLPASFIIRDTKIFCDIKLKDFSNILYSLEVDSIIAYNDLKKLLPGIFDFKYIKKKNSMFYLNNNKNIILEIASSILGEKEANDIINEQIKNAQQ